MTANDKHLATLHEMLAWRNATADAGPERDALTAAIHALEARQYFTQRVTELNDALYEARRWQKQTDKVVQILHASARAAESQVAELRARCEAAERDAARYRLLRQRLHTRHGRMLAGQKKPILAFRIGGDLLEPHDFGKSYLSRERFEQECAALDNAIDAMLGAREEV